MTEVIPKLSILAFPHVSYTPLICNGCCLDIFYCHYLWICFDAQLGWFLYFLKAKLFLNKGTWEANFSSPCTSEDVFILLLQLNGSLSGTEFGVKSVFAFGFCRQYLQHPVLRLIKRWCEFDTSSYLDNLLFFLWKFLQSSLNPWSTETSQTYTHGWLVFINCAGSQWVPLI